MHRGFFLHIVVDFYLVESLYGVNELVFWWKWRWGHTQIHAEPGS